VAKLDHLAVTVGDLVATRDWYTTVLGLEVEFDTGKVSGLKDKGDFTLILSQDGESPSRCSLYFQVPDVQIAYDERTGRGVAFRYSPRDNDWG
jgi:catechol 2,3-dioxygenase-like lactoylglutathione lyase family enzyme